MRKILIICFAILFAHLLVAQDASYRFAVLKYSGGGDWYANLETSVNNLIAFCNKNLGTSIAKEQDVVEVGSTEMYNYPFIHMTGHGNVVFSAEEAEALRNYLIAGGFLHISDNYGLDQFIRTEMKKVFPELSFVELPYDHPVFHMRYPFDKGLPKIHEHDGKRPQLFALIWEGRIVCLYDYECDLGDGWEDTDVHHDSEEKHNDALKMGANIVSYVLMGEEQKITGD